jgi:hypothetical protein
MHSPWHRTAFIHSATSPSGVAESFFQVDARLANLSHAKSAGDFDEFSASHFQAFQVVGETNMHNLTKALAKVGLALGNTGIIIASQKVWKRVSQIGRVLVEISFSV